MMEEIPDPTLQTNRQGGDTAKLTAEGCSFTSGSCTKIRKVAIIGAGPTGLCAARHLFAPGSGFTGCLYEQAGDLGGTWLYSDATGKDRFGLPIHSTLYYDLWTNLPKETMTYPGFEYKDEERSYLPAARVLQYLVDYADHYNLHPHIKLHHHVSRVAPVGNSWSVTALELTTQVEQVTMFDSVIVCSGPNIIPVYPKVDGLARFSGRQLHSREYRKASAFEGKRVLIIGLGPSGIDISFYLIPVAKQVIISHNMPTLQGFSFPREVIIKPVVTSMQDKTVYFSDDTEEEVDVIIHCTGYTYHYPFLTPECGLIVDQHVTPLYKHFINIEHPTMCLVGIPRKCPHQYMVDYQIRTFMKVLRGEVSLPSKEAMLADMEEDRTKRAQEGQRKKDYHKMNATRNEEYFQQLAELGELEPIPPVILKIFCDAFKTAIKDFVNFRKTVYKILDDENFVKNSVKSSNVGVKFSDDQFKISYETDLSGNDLQLKEVDDIGEKNNVSVLTVDTDDQSAVQGEQGQLKVIQEEIKCEEDDDSGTNIKEIKEEATILETTYTRTVVEEETITERNGTIKVKAVVEVTHSNVGDYENENLRKEDEVEEGNRKNESLTISVNGGGGVSLDVQDGMSKPMCGDEIVKIIQTEEGGAFR